MDHLDAMGFDAGYTPLRSVSRLWPNPYRSNNIETIWS